jgi:hypothetical protein
MIGNPSQRIAAGERNHRIAGIIAVACWITALTMPYDLSYTTFHRVDHGPGWWLFAAGWIAPVGYCFAWYANVFFAIAVVRLITGTYPGYYLTTVGLLIALTALFPCAHFDWAYSSKTLTFFRGPAIWIWLCGFAVIWLAAALPENWSKIDVPSFDDQNLILAIVVMVLLITSQFWIFGLMLSFS